MQQMQIKGWNKIYSFLSYHSFILIIQDSHCVNTGTGLGGDRDTGNSASFADLVIQLKENRKTKSTAALPTEADHKVCFQTQRIVHFNWFAFLP